MLDPILEQDYGEEALAGNEAAPWLAAESLTVEHGGEPLSRHAVRVEAKSGELVRVGRPRRFETSRMSSQPRLFGLDSLGEGGWLKAMRLSAHLTSRTTARSPSPPDAEADFAERFQSSACSRTGLGCTSASLRVYAR